MSGIFGGGSAPAKTVSQVESTNAASAATARSEERAEAQHGGAAGGGACGCRCAAAVGRLPVRVCAQVPGRSRERARFRQLAPLDRLDIRVQATWG